MSSSRREQVLLSLMGRDRPGLLDAVAHAIAEHQGNWLESRMVRLAGRFAGLLRVDLPVEKSAALRAALEQISELDLQLTGMTPTAGAEAQDDEDDGPRSASLELTGYDRPGIVRTVTKLLLSQDVDIETFESALRRAPMSGEPTFFAQARLHLNGDGAVEDLQRAIERIGTDLMVDIRLDD